MLTCGVLRAWSVTKFILFSQREKYFDKQWFLWAVIVSVLTIIPEPFLFYIPAPCLLSFDDM
jgi:hypothetical protein